VEDASAGWVRPYADVLRLTLNPDAVTATHKPEVNPNSISPSDDLLKRAIGDSEGTRNKDGSPNKNYWGRKDPGNGKWNVGSFSHQHGGQDPEAADRIWLEELRKAEATIQQQARDKWGANLSLAAVVAALDGYTQSPHAAQYFVGYLETFDPSPDQIIEARTKALEQSRAEIGGPQWLNVRRDQTRRVRALMRHL
jgi:hypothetical protein